ncbi:MAG: hypothetical protein QGG48_13025, partial [Desulfatiglandales bacterium]|nr:hypothetical protein [Desulfatiglandales bacterium]
MDIPFYLAGKWVADHTGFSVRIDRTPYNNLPREVIFEVFAVSCGHSIYALMGVVAIYFALLKVGVSRRVSSVVGILLFAAGPISWYSVTGFAHAAGFLMAGLILLLGAWMVSSKRITAWQVLLLGLAGGWASVVRYPNLVYIVGFTTFLLIVGEGGLFARLKRVILMGLGFFCVAAITPLYWYLSYGKVANVHLGVNPYELAFFPRIILSSPRGLFFWHPLFAVATVGILILLYKMFKKGVQTERPLCQLNLLGIMLFGMVAGFYNFYKEWGGGWAFGTRFLTGAVVFLVPGLAYLLMLVEKWKMGDGSSRLLASTIKPIFWLVGGYSYLLFILARAGLFYRSTEANVAVQL